MDDYDIAQEVRLERQVHKGSFLLLEGKEDIARFDKFISHTCSPVNCFGRLNAIGATERLYDEGFTGALAIIDADFDRICGGVAEHEGIIYSASHDMDLDWASLDVLDRYLNQVGDPESVRREGGVEEVRRQLLEGLRPVSVARLLNSQGRVRYKLSEVDLSECFVGLSIDIDRFVAKVFEGRGRPADDVAAFKKLILAHSPAVHDLLQLTNGHDFLTALGVALRNPLGLRKVPQTWGTEVGLHIRLVFQAEDLISTELYLAVRAWETENPPYRIWNEQLDAGNQA